MAASLSFKDQTRGEPEPSLRFKDQARTTEPCLVASRVEILEDDDRPDPPTHDENTTTQQAVNPEGEASRCWTKRSIFIFALGFATALVVAVGAFCGTGNYGGSDDNDTKM